MSSIITIGLVLMAGILLVLLTCRLFGSRPTKSGYVAPITKEQLHVLEQLSKLPPTTLNKTKKEISNMIDDPDQSFDPEMYIKYKVLLAKYKDRLTLQILKGVYSGKDFS